MLDSAQNSPGGSLDSWVADFLRLVSPEAWSSTPSQASQPPAEDDGVPVVATEADLAAYVWNTFGVRIPNVRVCPHHCTPWEAFCRGYFAPGRPEDPRVLVIKGSRGLSGKSTLLALLGTTIATTLRADVTILGGSGQQSERVQAAMAKFWSAPNAPRDMLRSDPGVTKTKLKWGNEITALTASQKSVRGPHPLALLIDEADEMELALFDASMGQTMDQRGQVARTVIASTHQYDDGTMTEVLRRAKDKGWAVLEWCWKESLEPHGWLTASQVARKRGEMTAQMWNVEVELQEPNPEGRAFPQELVDRMFAGQALAADGLEAGEFLYREFAPPVDGASYATGGDWARSKAFVEIATLRDDVFPLRLVAYQRFRKRPIGYIVAQWERQLSRFPGAAAHDATSMGGAFMHDLIGQSDGDDMTVDGVVMQGARRRLLFTNYTIAVEQEEIVAPRVEVLWRQHRSCRNDDLFGNGHPPDGVVACAMAYTASSAGHGRGMRVLRPNVAPPGEALPAEPVPALSRALSALGRNGGNGGNGHG